MTGRTKQITSPGLKTGIALIGLILGALILRNAVVLIGTDLGAPLGLSQRILPPDSKLEQIDALLITPEIDWDRHSPAQITAAARRARLLDPLDAWPFALQGLAESRKGNEPLARKLFGEAHRRNLRSPLPHLLLLIADARSGDVETTLKRLVQFMAQRPRLSEPLMPLIRQVFAKEHRGEFIAELDRNPALRAQLLANFSRTEGGESVVTQLLARPGVTREQKIDSAQQFGLREKHALGYPLFRSIVGDEFTVPFDREFKGLPGPQPYVWTVLNNGDVTADFSRRNAGDKVALDVESFGSNLIDVVTQVIRIQPGRYTLQVQASPVEGESSQGSMRWVLTCEGSRSELVRLAFAATAKPGTKRVDFAVPTEACEYQRLTLMAVPSDGSGPMRMRFSRIAIDPASSRR